MTLFHRGLLSFIHCWGWWPRYFCQIPPKPKLYQSNVIPEGQFFTFSDPDFQASSSAPDRVPQMFDIHRPHIFKNKSLGSVTPSHRPPWMGLLLRCVGPKKKRSMVVVWFKAKSDQAQNHAKLSPRTEVKEILGPPKKFWSVFLATWNVNNKAQQHDVIWSTCLFSKIK